MIKFPKIGQFRAAVKAVRMQASYVGRDKHNYPIYDNTLAVPTLDYVGTVKLHGTNASVVQRPDGSLTPQSRNRTLALDNDNAGFARFVLDTIGEEFWSNLFGGIRMQFADADTVITIYGEWCGSGIQKGVAISEVEKMFVIFAIRLHEDEDTIWLTPKQMKSIPAAAFDGVKMIFDFPSYEMTIDFDKPGLSQNTLVELTEQVEAECSVGKSFGVSGTGKGIVWRCITPGYLDSKFWFKIESTKKGDGF